MNLQDERFKEFLKQTSELATSCLNLVSQLQERRRLQSKQANKDWQIIEFRTGILDISYTVNPMTGRFCAENLSEEEMISKGDKIYSVKRLSDGEVFTVGQKVFRNKSADVIDELKIEFGHLNALFHSGNVTAAFDISELQSLQPLFKTEDNKEIFKGDVFWYLSGDKSQVWQCTHADDDNAGVRFKFSTKESAEEYILLNKPILSLFEVSESLGGRLTKGDAEFLRKLAQSKITKP